MGCGVRDRRSRRRRTEALLPEGPEPKSVKNRVHLDINVGGGRDTPMDERKARVNSEVERVVGLGATKIEEHSDQDEYWVVMQDVEGNEFCLQ